MFIPSSTKGDHFLVLPVNFADIDASELPESVEPAVCLACVHRYVYVRVGNDTVPSSFHRADGMGVDTNSLLVPVPADLVDMWQMVRHTVATGEYCADGDPVYRVRPGSPIETVKSEFKQRVADLVASARKVAAHG